MRNDSSHGGKVLTENDARNTYNHLIRIRKILIEIIEKID